MHSFPEISKMFEEKFAARQFPEQPKTLYDAAQHLLTLGGKRIRPVMCIMGNELVNEIHHDAWQVASAIELFHNFTLVHDDIMDKAPLRRGAPTVHTKFGESAALLAGDVMLVAAYEHLRNISNDYLQQVLKIFNVTATQVCEGQQLDMDFETRDNVTLEDYVNMIGLKTSVLLAASLQLGAVLGGAGTGNQQHLYGFGKNLGIAFQIQDDYLDAFGDPGKFGKQVGGDIMANKKTFLLIRALQTASPEQLKTLKQLLKEQDSCKIEKVLAIYRASNVDQWARDLKEQYMKTALDHLEEIAVLSSRKKPLRDLADFLLNREM
jgi:geranylgeranyl diphosphate synthase, type II